MTPQDLTATLIDGRYRLLRRLGRGGFAEVWLAEDQDERLFGKKVAVKLLRPEHHQKPEHVREDEIRRFIKETQLAARLHDPDGHLVSVTQAGCDQGRHYFVMEYIDGPSLRTYLKEHGALPRRVALDIAAQLCDGIAVAHEHGIAHRDLKPENILLVLPGLRARRSAPLVKIVDLGIAKLVRDTAPITLHSQLMGTPEYMAPELHRGVDSAAGYFLADIYAIGVILFEMLAGYRPSKGSLCDQPTRLSQLVTRSIDRRSRTPPRHRRGARPRAPKLPRRRSRRHLQPQQPAHRAKPP
jgi:serine/threonine protein kinase